jgi:subtilisin family serine protease
MSEKRVEILGMVSEKEGFYLDFIHNPKSGKYFAPQMLDIPFFAGIKKLHSQGLTGKGSTIAIIDTGMMLNHPWIKRSLIQSKDFSGEGIEDKNGHGTMVTLLALLVAPDANIINIKAMDASGNGTEEDLIKGINWAAEQKVDSINISAGIDHKKWGLFDCDGSCPICKAAENACKAGIFISAAAGNEPHKTYCPAKPALVKKDLGIVSTAAFDVDKNEMADYSGIGTVTGPVGTYHFAPVE